MTRAVVFDANLLVLLVAGQTDAHLADIPQCPTRARSPYQSGHRNRNSGKNPIGLINVTRWIGGVSLVLRAIRLPSIMPQQSARVGLPFDEESFDGVVLKDVLEHVANPVALVREVRRVLRPGGRVFASSPDAQRWVWDDYTHRRPFTRKSFRKLFEDQGMRVDQLGYESVMPGSGIVSGWTKRNRRPPLLGALAHLPMVRRNVWLVASR